MQIQSFTIPDPRHSVARLHREFSELAVTAQSWDHVLETAIGTYPTHEFAANFRAFGDRLESARLGARAYGLEDLGNMALLRLRIPPFVNSRLEHMARERTTFQHANGFGGQAWASMLDQVVSDLQRGERLLYGKLVTMQPSTPKTPNDGTGGSRLPYPGTGPRPTPIP